MSEISLIYLTSRPKPMFEWFVDSIYNQLVEFNKPTEGQPDKEKLSIQLVFIDVRLWYEGERRKEQLKKIIDGRFDYIHVPPKPSVWQGPKRLCHADYFAASNARNTGCMYARGDYMVFVDDLSVLLPGWLNNVVYTAGCRWVVGGAYKKVLELEVENGSITHHRERALGIDSRWNTGSDLGIVTMPGSSLYGCSFGIPTEYYLNVNGQDEIYCSAGGEDYDLGIRLGRAGYKIFYNRNMLTYESEELHQQEPVMQYIITHDANQKFDSSWVLLNRVNGEARITTISNYYNLREAREQVLAGGEPPEILQPQHYWYNGTPIKDM